MRTLAALVFFCGCASTANKPDAPDPNRPRAKDFVPLAVGNAWSYDVTPHPPGAPPAKVEILRLDPDGYYVDSQKVRLAPREDGVFDGKRFWIAEPIQVGHTWMAIPKQGVVENYSVLSLGDPCAAPAGQWKGCLVVEATEAGLDPEGRPVTHVVRWTYAPHVGLVHMLAKVKFPDGNEQTTTEMKLVDYTVGVAAQKAE